MEHRLVELMFKAIQSLPGEEQDEVLRGLLAGVVTTQAPALTPTLVTGPRSRIERLVADPAVVAGQPVVSTAPGPESELKMLPVRLPIGDYERLRAFSREHGFSMAVIIRTLVERFLDERAPQVGPDAGPAAPAAPAAPAGPDATVEADAETRPRPAGDVSAEG